MVKVDKDLVVIGGGLLPKEALSPNIYRLECKNKYYQWHKMDAKLEKGRYLFVAAMVPIDLGNFNYYLVISNYQIQTVSDVLDYCTTEDPCPENEGDCDHNNECQNGLVCGQDNCPSTLKYEWSIDCCMKPIIGSDTFCKTDHLCYINEGDCDNNNECAGSLACGVNNCNISLGFDSETDCCYEPSQGDKNFCQTDHLCQENEGDCDNDNECQNGLTCGENNCPTSLGFDLSVDCCVNRSLSNGDSNYCTYDFPCAENEGPCQNDGHCHGNLECGTNNCFDFSLNCCFIPCYKHVGDGYCDDENNKIECEWDGDDCCGSIVATDYCNECDCLDPDHPYFFP